MLRCFACSDSFGSCSAPDLVAAISARCDGTMIIHTLPVISVPIMTPVWTYAARPLNTCVNAKIDPNRHATEMIVASRGLVWPIVLQMPS